LQFDDVAIIIIGHRQKNIFAILNVAFIVN
jgi:hypothetical protein